MMSRRFSDAQNYYQRVKELQEKLKQSEDERMKLEKKFNKILQTSRAEERIRRLSWAKDNYFQLLEEDRLRSDRKDSLMQILDRIENRACSINAKTERLRLLRQHYEAYMERTYPGWKANESKFYESYNEKLKAINSHFRTLSNDYTDFPTWKTSPKIEMTRDEFLNSPSPSIMNFQQNSYSNNSSFYLPDQNREISKMKKSDSQTDIYNYSYSQPPRKLSINVPNISIHNTELSPLEKNISIKTTNYTLNNLTDPSKGTFNSNVSKSASLLSDFDRESFSFNDDINFFQTRQYDVDLDKDFNTKSSFYTNDPVDRPTSSSQLSSSSPRFSRYDSSRQTLKYNYNPITPPAKYSNQYNRPLSNVKSPIPKSLTRSASLDTFTNKYSPKYRLQSSIVPASSYYSGETLFRSNSLGRIPQEKKLSFSNSNQANDYSYGVSNYKKHSPWTRLPDRKSYSTLSPIYSNTSLSSDAGYYTHRSISPGNSSTHSSYNPIGSGYSRYGAPRLSRINSNQNHYAPYTINSKRDSLSNLPYTSNLSRSQSFSEIDDLDYLSRKKNHNMSSWSQYPMGRERFYYDNRSNNSYGASPYSNQYRSRISPEPSYNTNQYSFQADKSTSTDDGIDEDKNYLGKKIGRAHYAVDKNGFSHYNNERPLDGIGIYDGDSQLQSSADGLEKRNIDDTPPQKSIKTNDSKALSTKEYAKRGLAVDEIKSNEGDFCEMKTPLLYSQQVLQTLEERTEEDITQSTSDNPSLSSDQHWENEIGKLKDIMSYDPQPGSYAIDDGNYNTPLENQHYNYRPGIDSTARDSIDESKNGFKSESNKTNENSQLPDLKQEIEMLKQKKLSITEGHNSKPEKEYTQNNTRNDRQNTSGTFQEDVHSKKPIPYSNFGYEEYPHTPARVKVDAMQEGQAHPDSNAKIRRNFDHQEIDGEPRRISPSYGLGESQALEKQDRPEKNGEEKSNEEINKSSHTSLPRETMQVLQSRVGKEYDNQDNPEQKARRKIKSPEEQEGIEKQNIKDMGYLEPSYEYTNSNQIHPSQEIDFEKSKEIAQTQVVENNRLKGNQQHQGNMNNKPTNITSSVSNVNSTADSINVNEDMSRNNNQLDRQHIYPDRKKDISGNAQNTKVNNQNIVPNAQQNPALQENHIPKTGETNEGKLQQTISQSSPNYEQQQFNQSDRGAAPPVPIQIIPTSSVDGQKEQIYQPPLQLPQQSGEETAPQNHIVQNEQSYSEQPQYKNYEEGPYDQYGYNVTSGEGYQQQQYDDSNAYQYDEKPIAEQYPEEQSHQQFEDVKYPQQQGEKYPQPKNGQYPQSQERHYPLQQEGQYPQQPGEPYPQQEGPYPYQQESGYPQQQEGEYSQQQNIQYPPQQDEQYPSQFQEGSVVKTQMDSMQRQYPDGQAPEQYSDVPVQQQYLGEPQEYSNEQLSQQYLQGQNQQPYQEGQYPQQYEEQQMAQQYSDDQYNNYQQNNTAYPENYYDQQQYGGYNEQPSENFQQQPDQYNTTNAEEQFYTEGQANTKEPVDQYPPTEQMPPNAENFDAHQVEPQGVPVSEQLMDNGSTEVSQEKKDGELAKQKDNSLKDPIKVEPEKLPPSGSNVVGGEKKGETKNISSKQEDNTAAAAEKSGSSSTGDKPTSGAAKPAPSSKVEEKTEVGASKQAPVTPPKGGEKTSDNSGGSGKGAARTGEKKTDSAGKASSKGPDTKRAESKTKAGEKIGGLKAAVRATTALNKK